MNKSLIPTIFILILSAIICVIVAGAYRDTKREETLAKISEMNGGQTEAVSGSADESEAPVVNAKRLTAEDTCIVLGKNVEDKEITLRNIEGGQDRVLKYNNLTKFITKHDKPLTAAEIMPGDIVDAIFTTHDLLISELRQSKRAWEIKDVSRFTIDEKGKSITVADDVYKMASNSIIASGDKVGKLLDVTGLDTITVRGIGKDVYSVQIDKGHGYIRISNDSYFVGGWIEIGQEMITILTENMLIPVPEGTYDVKVTNKGYVGRETLTVSRDSETKLDLSKVDIEEVAIGHVQFTVVPDYAQLFVDGIMTDFEERVPLEYGIHSVRAELAGYETVHANIKVASENANITIKLDEAIEEEGGSSSTAINPKAPPDSSVDTIVKPGSTSGSDTVTNADTGSSSTAGESTSVNGSTVQSADTVISDNKQIYVEGPAGCEVYLDGRYIGIAPCHTEKVTGDHTITLAKSGYTTKTYTVSVSNDGNDLTMSFSELDVAQ